MPNTERQHNFLENSNFLCLISRFSLSSLEISMGKKEKTEVGTEVGKGVKNNPTHIWSYLCGIPL